MQNCCVCLYGWESFVWSLSDHVEESTERESSRAVRVSLTRQGVFPHSVIRSAKSIEMVGLAAETACFPMVQHCRARLDEGSVYRLVSLEVSLSGVGQYVGTSDGQAPGGDQS